MTYRTPESLIRDIMSRKPLNESAIAQDNMTPSLKTDDTARLTGAVEVLRASGVASAEIKGNAISVTAAEVNIAANVLDAAFLHGMITVKPMLTSPEAVEMPVASNPALSVAKEETETVEEGSVNLKLPDQKDAEDQTSESNLSVQGTITAEPRTLRNRMENQVKKVDEDVEDVEQVDELSKGTLSSYVDKAVSDIHNKGFKSGAAYSKGDTAGTVDHSVKSIKRQIKIGKAVKKLAKEEAEKAEESVELTELSYTKLKSYEKKGSAQVADAAKKNKLDSRIAKRANYVAKAKQKSTVKLKKAAFGEEASPVQKLVSLCEALKIRETLHSESGDHHAKIYRDTEFGEHRVKYFPHGKHHEPADSFHSDHDDAHHTAKQELRRMDKFSGALKESTEEEIKALQEDEQLDELSKATLGRYIRVDNAHKAVGRMTKEDAEEGTLPFQDKQLDELSNNTLKSYIKKSGTNRDHHLKMDSVYTHAARKASDHDAKAGSYKHAHQHSDKAFNRDVGIDRAKEKLKSRKVSEEVEQLDEITKVGTYTNRFGHTLTMHRSPNDSKHHMLVHDGSVVKTHHGSSEEFHKKLTKDGFQGALHEENIVEISKALVNRYGNKATTSQKFHMDRADHHTSKKYEADDHGEMEKRNFHSGMALKHEKKVARRQRGIDSANKRLAKEETEQLDELSPGTLTKYAVKAVSDKKNHVARATASFARGNAAKGEPEVKSKMHKDAQKHSLKAINRHEGIKKATEKLGKKCETAGVCEDVEQVDELSTGLLRAYREKAHSDGDKHYKNAQAKSAAKDENGFKKSYAKAHSRWAGSEKARKKIVARGEARPSHKPGSSLHSFKAAQNHSLNGGPSSSRFNEEIELTEAKVDVEKAKKHLFKHPESDAIGKTMMGATKHFNYVQDAVDHVYNNHSKDLGYEDFDKIRPHLEDHFKKSGLK
jgi:hypothetical protein